MELVHRKIDWARDREYVLEAHCCTNYTCDSAWKRAEMDYATYRAEWFALAGQVAGFTDALLESMADARTLAEIIVNESGATIGYLWVPFRADEESGFCFADVQDLYVEEAFRKAGIASELMRYAEDTARSSGAKVIRSGTGCENGASLGLHRKLGYEPYRVEFEKVL